MVERLWTGPGYLSTQTHYLLYYLIYGCGGGEKTQASFVAQQVGVSEEAVLLHRRCRGSPGLEGSMQLQDVGQLGYSFTCQ